MANLSIHFINVGHGDCTIIEFPSGRMTMVDINNSRVLDEESARELGKLYGVTDEQWVLTSMSGERPQKIREYEETVLTDPVDFYLDKCGNKNIFRFILTHPDMDHMTGLYKLHSVQGIEIGNFWDTKHSVEKSADPDDWEQTPYDIRDWREYKKLRDPSEDVPKSLFLLRGTQGKYYEEDGIRIWAPFEHDADVSEDDKLNQLSYVLLIEYGECKILLGGDAEKSTWQEIYDKLDGKYPKIHLLKAPHHGRKSGYHWQSVKAMSPDYTVVSVGELKKKDDAFASYEKWSEKGCYSTRLEGNITAKCWSDGDVWLYGQLGNRL